MESEVISLLQKVYGTSVNVVHSFSIAGGCINNTQVLSISNGEKVFLKHHPHPPKDFFLKEAHGLRLLSLTQGGPRVPKILSMNHPNYLLIEYIQEESPQDNYFESFGRVLARMHLTTESLFGLDRDNYIGETIQQNTRHENPIIFFREHRIKSQQKLARKRKLLPKTVDLQLDSLCKKLENLLDVTNEKPALSHGDLWSRNHFCGPNQEPCLFDPAVYYGLREADLAMTELFGKMPQYFYDAYQEAFPLNPGYDERRSIYNLYHLLNHLNLFGNAYLEAVKSSIAFYV